MGGGGAEGGRVTSVRGQRSSDTFRNFRDVSGEVGRAKINPLTSGGLSGEILTGHTVMTTPVTHLNTHTTRLIDDMLHIINF